VYTLSDILETIQGCDSEISELSSDDESDDIEGPVPNETNQSQDVSSDSGSEYNDSDNVPLAVIAQKTPAANKYSFDRKMSEFLPPEDVEFVDVTCEPEPTDDTPYDLYSHMFYPHFPLTA
jgi:hypothetical protein